MFQMMTRTTHYRAATVPGMFSRSHSVSLLDPRGESYHLPHFTDEEIEAQSVGHLPKVTQPGNAGAAQTQAGWLQVRTGIPSKLLTTTFY